MSWPIIIPLLASICAAIAALRGLRFGVVYGIGRKRVARQTNKARFVISIGIYLVAAIIFGLLAVVNFLR